MRRAVATSLVLLLAAFACAEQPGPMSSGKYAPLATTNVDPLPYVPAPPPPPRDDGRLPPLATPLRYALALAIDPGMDRFSGVVTILVSVPAPTSYVVLHGRDLHVSRALAKLGEGGARELPATTSARPAHGSTHDDELVLAFPERLPTGQATLEIHYDAPFGDDLAGVYRVKEGGEWYAFTQFESVDARRAFPCFDEPSWKTAFDVSLAVPKGMTAVANAPEASRSDGETWTTVKFQTTRPLPTYLVAFAIGNLETRDGPTTPVPIRLVAPRGKTKLGGLALDAAAALVTRLGDYFGIRYPYPKLDLVAVPDFAAGAMENPGLITFREELLLLDPDRAPTSSRRAMVSVTAHELAHQWFGDLVTLAWWNDTWLNEGFATWSTQKIVDQWQPSFGSRLDFLSGVDAAMDQDALASARRVREPVTSVEGIVEAFDGITYQKGAAILSMIEHWIGEDVFQRGVRDYLHAKAWQTATADDLLHALDAASGKDVTAMAGTFLDQTGVPMVETSFVCPSVGPATASLTQSVWEPLGEPARERQWVLPLCADVEGRGDRACATVTAGAATYAALGKCPGSIFPNADLAGYFRFSMSEKDFGALTRGHAALSLVDQIGLLGNLWAAVRSGAAKPRTLFDALAAFDASDEGHLVEKTYDVLAGARHAMLEDPALPRFRAWVAARFRRRKLALGWETAPSDADDRIAARRATLLALGTLAEDDATLREAEGFASKWLADPASVSSEVASVALPLASRRAGVEREVALESALSRTTTPAERGLVLRALGALRTPDALRRALDFAIGSKVKISELGRILFGALNDPEARPVAIAWLESSYAPLRAKMKGRSIAVLAGAAGGACTAGERDSVAAFLGDKLAGVEGAERGLRAATERAGLCVALRAATAADTTAYFTR